MRLAARFGPALLGILILTLMLRGSAGLHDNLCQIARHPDWLSQHCFSLTALPLLAAIVAVALIALTLILLLRWQRARPQDMSYDSDSGRWIVLGWILVAGGVISFLAGMMLIGSNGWPFSHQSRHISVKTGQLPLSMSTVQRRYFADYFRSGRIAVALREFRRCHDRKSLAFAQSCPRSCAPHYTSWTRARSPANRDADAR